MKKVSKCVFGKGYCPTMDERLEPSDGLRGRGFLVLNIMNFIHGTSQVFGVVYKASAKDRGVILNFCPFCGAQMGDSWVQKARAALDKKNQEAATKPSKKRRAKVKQETPRGQTV